MTEFELGPPNTDPASDDTAVIAGAVRNTGRRDRLSRWGTATMPGRGNPSIVLDADGNSVSTTGGFDHSTGVLGRATTTNSSVDRTE